MKKIFLVLASAALMALAVSCGNCCCNKAAEATEEKVECACEQKCDGCSNDCTKCDNSCESCESCKSCEACEGCEGACDSSTKAE